MFRNRSYQSFSAGFGPGLTPGIKYLLLANIAVFAMRLAFPRLPLDTHFGLNPSAILNSLALWQLFTYMFLHGGFWHIFFNMFALWMFGSDLERQWGTRPFIKFYLITGVGAGVITFLLQIYSNIPTIGASGAIFGVMVAFAMMY